MLRHSNPVLQLRWPVVLLAAVLAWAGPAQADISRDEAAHRVQQQTGGRVLAVERSDGGGHAQYRVKVLLGNGDVRMVVIDARSDRRH